MSRDNNKRQIVDWLVSCINQAESGGYQESDASLWADDPPTFTHNGKDSITATWNGKVFDIKITQRKT